MRECRNAGMLECRNAGMQECWNAGMQECGNAGMQTMQTLARLLAGFHGVMGCGPTTAV